MSTRLMRLSGLCAGTVVLVVGCAHVAGADDADARQRIERRLDRAQLPRGGDIHVDVRGNRAILSGTVTSLPARRQAEKAALREAAAVDNRLQVVPPREVPDEQIRQEAENAIVAYPYYSVFDGVAVEVKDGAVTLRGSVRHAYRRSDIEERVAALLGVRALNDLVRVQPVSALDDELRAEVYRAIYGDERFAGYAQWPDPPVHIVVEGGRVTLTGAVGSRVEQQLVGQLARGVLSLNVDNRVSVAGERPPAPSPAGS
jgi:hyperosmotically inducible protein